MMPGRHYASRMVCTNTSPETYMIPEKLWLEDECGIQKGFLAGAINIIFLVYDS